MNLHFQQTENSSSGENAFSQNIPSRKADDSYSNEELSAYLSVLAEAVVRMEEKLDELSQQL